MESMAAPSEVPTSDMGKILDAITALIPKIDDLTTALEEKMDILTVTWMDDLITSFDIKIDKKMDNILDQQVEVKMEVMKGDSEKEFRNEIQTVKEIANIPPGDFKETQGQVKKLEIKSDSISMEYNLDAIVLAEMREEECILSLIGALEKLDENMRKYIVDTLVQHLETEEEDMDSEIDKIFRVDSRYVRDKKLSRYFVKKVIKEQNLKKYYSERSKIVGLGIT